MDDIKATPWPEEENQAFTDAVGRWVRSLFAECVRTGNSVQIGPTSERHLALIWRAGREYEQVHPAFQRGADDHETSSEPPAS